MTCPLILAFFLVSSDSDAIVAIGKSLLSSFDQVSRPRGGSPLSGFTRCRSMSSYCGCSSSVDMLIADLIKPMIVCVLDCRASSTFRHTLQFDSKIAFFHALQEAIHRLTSRCFPMSLSDNSFPSKFFPWLLGSLQ